MLHGYLLNTFFSSDRLSVSTIIHQHSEQHRLDDLHVTKNNLSWWDIR